MILEQWEKKVLEAPGAEDRVREIEEELRLAAGLTALREKAGVTQRELAERIGVSQPRIAAIERSRNVTIDVLEQYVTALGGHLEVSVVQGPRRTSLLGHPPSGRSTTSKTTSHPQASGAVYDESPECLNQAQHLGYAQFRTSCIGPERADEEPETARSDFRHRQPPPGRPTHLRPSDTRSTGTLRHNLDRRPDGPMQPVVRNRRQLWELTDDEVTAVTALTTSSTTPPQPRSKPSTYRAHDQADAA